MRARLTHIKALVPDRLKDAHAALDRLNDGLNQAKRNAPDMMVRFFDDLLQKIKAIFTGPRLENAMSGPTNSTLIRKQARADAPRLEMTGGARGKGRALKDLPKSAKGLVGKEFEDYLTKKLGGTGSFKVNGREFDGAVGNRWYEAKSGNYWSDHVNTDKGFEKFKSDIGARRAIAKRKGASYEIHSNTPIPKHVKDWLRTKSIPFTEH